jgi:hypothetical protein
MHFIVVQGSVVELDLLSLCLLDRVFGKFLSCMDCFDVCFLCMVIYA